MKIADLMKSKKDVTIGYIGGSVTEGREYSDVFTAYLKETYPENTITEVNAGVGGTTSFLGVYRSERDLFSYKPDIVLIEFSLNDNQTKPEFDYSIFGRTVEGLIRKALKLNENMIIIQFGITSTPLEENFFSKGINPQSHEVHMKVAKHYNIPYINAGKIIHDNIVKNNDDISTFWNDSCHPNKKGGKAYADILIDSLKDYDWDINKNAGPLYDNNLENAQLLMGKDYKNDNWKVSKCTLYGKLPDYIYCNKPGAEVEVDFYGSAIGIYCTTEKDSGILEYSIDGGEWVKVSTWDNYCLSFNRAHNYIFDSDLEKKTHKLVVRVCEEKDEDSEGTYIRIGAFLGEVK